jgi:hypothetical protein
MSSSASSTTASSGEVIAVASSLSYAWVSAQEEATKRAALQADTERPRALPPAQRPAEWKRLQDDARRKSWADDLTQWSVVRCSWLRPRDDRFALENKMASRSRTRWHRA